MRCCYIFFVFDISLSQDIDLCTLQLILNRLICPSLKTSYKTPFYCSRTTLKLLYLTPPLWTTNKQWINRCCILFVWYFTFQTETNDYNFKVQKLKKNNKKKDEIILFFFFTKIISKCYFLVATMKSLSLILTLGERELNISIPADYD